MAAVRPSAGLPSTADAQALALEAARGDEAFKSLVEGIVRISRILPAGTAAGYDAAVFTESAEKELHRVVDGFTPSSEVDDFVNRGHVLVAPITTFFEEILVMDEDPEVRAARLGLLARTLSLAPRGLDWVAVDALIG